MQGNFSIKNTFHEIGLTFQLKTLEIQGILFEKPVYHEILFIFIQRVKTDYFRKYEKVQRLYYKKFKASKMAIKVIF